MVAALAHGVGWLLLRRRTAGLVWEAWNVLGACLGLGVVLTCSFTIVLTVLAVVAALNLVGELSSFTRIIDAVPFLRALDRAGRRDA